jgi:hypothetical protein
MPCLAARTIRSGSGPCRRPSESEVDPMRRQDVSLMLGVLMLVSACVSTASAQELPRTTEGWIEPSIAPSPARKSRCCRECCSFRPPTARAGSVRMVPR